MSVAEDLLALIRTADQRLVLPLVEALHLPSRASAAGRDAEFGVVTLAEGSAGFFYAWLDDTLERLRRMPPRDPFSGTLSAKLAEHCVATDAARKAIGLATASAVSQHVFARAGYDLDSAGNSIAQLAPQADDHLGMVGYFPPLVERLRKAGVRLSVIEKRPDRLAVEDGVTVTLDPRRLQDCNKVLCTAATLLNNTLDEILVHCRGADRVAIIGPTAGCFPDPLFERGVHVVGGSVVVDLPGLRARIARDEPWGETVRKYCLTRETYPGFETLLRRAQTAARGAP